MRRSVGRGGGVGKCGEWSRECGKVTCGVAKCVGVWGGEGEIAG